QSQGCKMRDKFRTNFIIVLPVALLTLGIYLWGSDTSLYTAEALPAAEWYKALPYLLVIILAIMGVNVLTVLLTGIVVTDIIGLASGSFGGIDTLTSAGAGLGSMCELILVTLLAGGVMNIIKQAGGFDYLIEVITSRISSRRAAEGVVALLTALTNLCTANNTIAILTTGSISRDLSSRYAIPPRKTASLMDVASCVVQGIIPYGAQLLMASGLAAISPMEIIPHLYYPMLLGVALILSIIFQYPRR
ncbi:MAG: Na+/H+ antiporter NhaC family protein, partial [Rikenellaceae bacterium]|nr:Na+/H+ antiporter NhaC family protein [Rikenellaceae bacterium]